MFKRMGILVFAVVIGFCCTSCTTPPAAPNGVLRIGCVTDYPPIMFKDARGEFNGAEADLGRALAAELGMTARFVPMAFNKLSDALLADKIDIIMAGMTMTDQRRIRLAFCSPYLVVGQMALVRLNEVPRYHTNLAIQTANTRVGVVAGTTGAQMVAKYFMNATIVTYQNPVDAVGALRGNHVDVVLYDAPVVWYYSAQYDAELAVSGELFSQEELAWAVRPGAGSLRDGVNQTLAKWKNDGTLDRILSRWIPFH